MTYVQSGAYSEGMPVITKPLIAFVVGIVAGGSGYVSYDYYHRLDGSRPPSSTTDRHPPVAAAATEPAKGLKCDLIETGHKTDFEGHELPQTVKNSTLVAKLLNDTQWVLISIDGLTADTFKGEGDNKPREPLALKTTDQTYVLFDKTDRYGEYANTIVLSIDRTTGAVYGFSQHSNTTSASRSWGDTSGHCEPTTLQPIL
jgi:hypothetical protein